jgi:hypothetical protein
MRKTEQDHDAAARAMRRLLETLSEPNAYGARGDLDDGTAVVLAPRNGVTVVRARVAMSAADAAAARGLAAWEDAARAKRLTLTEAGRAHVRRGKAPSGVDPFRAQHSPIEPHVLEHGAPPTLHNEGESPLAWLARRKDRDGRPFLARAQVEAGERFRRDVEKAQLLQRVTANWEATTTASRRGADAGASVSDVAMDARKRLARAYEAVGPELAGLLTDVCGYLKGMEVVESERGWPARSGKVVLKIALDRLARHYGLAEEARGPARSGAGRHWGAEDYRPSLRGPEAGG